MSRTRSEYRLALPVPEHEPVPGLESVDSVDRNEFATMLLDAYAGTVDDEGESFEEALGAADHYLGRALPAYSASLRTDGSLVAFCAVIEMDDQVRYWIDPIIVAPSQKRLGLGRRMVADMLGRLSADGVVEVGATITDGNVASERLFLGLGAERVGSWPRPNDEGTTS